MTRQIRETQNCKKLYNDGQTSITVQHVFNEIYFIVDFPDGSEQGFENLKDAIEAAGLEMKIGHPTE